MSLTRPRALAATVSAALVALAVATAAPAPATNPYLPGGGPSLRLVVDSPGVTFASPGSPGVNVACTAFTLGGVVESPGTPRAHSVRAGYLSTLSSSGCGTTTVTPTGSWNVVVPGDGSGTVWPMVLANATAHGAASGCSFDIAGTINGAFNTSTQQFRAASSTLRVSTVVGPLCALLDIALGDPVTVTGTWTNTPPAGSGVLTLGH